MAFNQAMLVCRTPSGLVSNILKDGTKAKLSTQYWIEGKGVKKGMKSLKSPARRHNSEWRCRCHSEELSASVNGQNSTQGPVIHGNAHNSSETIFAYEHANTLGPQADHSDGLWTASIKKLDAFHEFIRPYALVGNAVAAISVAFFPVERMADLSPLFFMGVLKTAVPVIFMGIYAMGVNQIFDVEIDKINKPSLPLASGELSIQEGVLITATFCATSLFMGLKSGSPPLLCALFVLFLLASGYSINLPLLRWKGKPLHTTLAITFNLGIVPHIPFFVHFQKYVLGRPVSLSKSVVFATVFMSLFAAVISVLKDIPDVEGDKRAGIRNFVVRLGPERVFWLGTNALLVGYGIAMLVGAASANKYSSLITILGHGLLASILWFRAQSVDIQEKTSTQSFYMLIWQLFTAEYLLLPFVR